MERRVSIHWTATAKEQLAALELKVRRGILAKADALLACDDPRTAHKPLVGPLQGFYRMTHARYRAVYTVEEDRLASGDVLLKIRVMFVAVGKRKEHDKRDIYKITEKIVKMGLVDLPDKDADEDDLRSGGLGKGVCNRRPCEV